MSLRGPGEALGVVRDGRVEVLLVAHRVGAEERVRWVMLEAEVLPLGGSRERLTRVAVEASEE